MPEFTSSSRWKLAAPGREVELFVKVIGCDSFQRLELVNSRIVHQHVQLPVSFLRLAKEAF